MGCTDLLLQQGAAAEGVLYYKLLWGFRKWDRRRGALESLLLSLQTIKP